MNYLEERFIVFPSVPPKKRILLQIWGGHMDDPVWVESIKLKLSSLIDVGCVLKRGLYYIWRYLQISVAPTFWFFLYSFFKNICPFFSQYKYYSSILSPMSIYVLLINSLKSFYFCEFLFGISKSLYMILFTYRVTACPSFHEIILIYTYNYCVPPLRKCPSSKFKKIHISSI